MLLIDIGSTYTKVAVVDETARRIVATDCSPTTIQDVGIGFNEVVLRIKAHGVPDDLLAERYASSSAAGGLRMVAVGLVPELTMEAARRAALGAGAKVVATFSFSLMSRQIAEIEAIKPDIILLAGGTDGGDTKTVIDNAGQLARSPLDVPIVFAGNREAADAVAEMLEATHKEIHIAENVMPTVSPSMWSPSAT